MKRIRLSLVTAALVLGLASVLAGTMPASAQTSAYYGRSRPAVVAKFSFESVININTQQRCLGIAAGNAGAWNCTYVNDQLWHYGGQLDSSGYYQLVNDVGQCLGVAGGSTNEGAQVVAGGCLGANWHDEYWTLDYTPGGSTAYVFNYKSGYVLDIKNGNTASGATVQQYHWISNDNNQLWAIVAPSNARRK